MQTVVSTSVPYATPAQFLAIYDYRPAGMLVRDDGTAATAANLLTDANLAQALLEASGEIELSAMVGSRYMPADLQALAATNTAGAALLAKLTCDIAAEFLRQRRLIPVREPYPQYAAALEKLQMLRDGYEILPFAQAASTGVPDTYTFNQNDVDNLNLITRNRWSWGQRGSYNSGFPGASSGSG
jgi:hypothetical protein